MSREAINIAILEMSEDGTLSSLKTKWWYERSECPSDTTKVDLKNKIKFFFLNFIGNNRIQNRAMH